MKIDASDGNIKEFKKMLAWIEICGSIGHTCQYFQVGVDGDGSGRLKFSFEDKEEQKQYDLLKKEMLSQYDKNDNDLKRISFE